MEKYQVQITETEIYLIEVEANNEEDAIEKAIERQSLRPEDYYHDSDGDAEII